ncbi:unnamed protein product [Clavelina lepadiformis]|uniref:Agrin n=1 Tax=Clavelina lepadiformis TaxID=159417 RepID=A0ABP0GAM0_CLALP
MKMYCNLPGKNASLRTIQSRLWRLSLVAFCVFYLASVSVEGSRLTRAIMMSLSPPKNTNCVDSTIVEKNETSGIILTGTATQCDNLRAGTYKCTLQVWRFMKGKRLATNLVTLQKSPYPFYKNAFVDVYGMGNPTFCKTNVKKRDTRIFFLNRSNDRLVLADSLLRITLNNLENTQAVIEGNCLLLALNGTPGVLSIGGAHLDVEIRNVNNMTKPAYRCAFAKFVLSCPNWYLFVSDFTAISPAGRSGLQLRVETFLFDGTTNLNMDHTMCSVVSTFSYCLRSHKTNAVQVYYDLHQDSDAISVLCLWYGQMHFPIVKIDRLKATVLSLINLISNWVVPNCSKSFIMLFVTTSVNDCHLKLTNHAFYADVHPRNNTWPHKVSVTTLPRFDLYFVRLGGKKYPEPLEMSYFHDAASRIGQKIQEEPKEPRDPCLDVICGFGARCQATDGVANCICSPASCDFQDGDSGELLTPVCGSDDITYPNLCRLKAAQCQTQRRIRVVSESECGRDCLDKDRDSDECRLLTTTAPVIDETVCEAVSCGYSSVCQVVVGTDGSRAPSCVCPVCDEFRTSPVCGSDGTTYRTHCDLKRMSCFKTKDISIVRRSSCDPCEVFNETTLAFERLCSGTCSFDDAGMPRCCDDVACDTEQVGEVCGSDGNTYESQCALTSFSCKTGRELSVIREGPCPAKKSMTKLTGSVGIEADDNCPGNCDPANEDFSDFIRTFEINVNQKLQALSEEDIDAKTLGEFMVTEVRKGSVILLFSAFASTYSEPITMADDPDAGTRWINDRLFDEASGAITLTISENGLTTVEGRYPADNVIVEDVCLDLQCEHGAKCQIYANVTGIFPQCSCDSIGDAQKLDASLACKLADDGQGRERKFVNMYAARRAMCESHTMFTFKDICREIPPDPCEDLGGCGEGEVCTVLNGIASCGCVVCGDEYKPVCTTDGQTFRSACEVHRQNCVSGGSLAIQKEGACESQCDDVKCWNGAQCETEAQGTVCVCPTACTDAYAPVCGSDCMTYDNECEMVVTACKNKLEITLAHNGPCGKANEAE